MYFPTIKNLRDFASLLGKMSLKYLIRQVSWYVRKRRKDKVLKSFKDGDMQFVLATKAFGMGVDILI